jgi:hypothetical protein
VNHKIGIKVEMKSRFFGGSCYSDDVGRRDMWRELKKGELTHAKRQSRSRTTHVTVGDSSNAPEPVRCGPEIAGEQAQLQAIDQNPPGWTAGKKAHAQSEQQVAREERPGSRELLGLVGNAIMELRNQASLPSPRGC